MSALFTYINISQSVSSKLYSSVLLFQILHNILTEKNVNL